MRARRAVLLSLLVMGPVPGIASAEADRHVEVSAGYSFVRDPSIDLTFPAGWTVSAAGTLNGWLSAVGDVSGSSKTTQTLAGDLRFSLHAFMLGARASAKVGRFVEFGEVLVGVFRGSGTAFGATTSSTRVGGQAGAGLDCPLTERLAVRGQVDFRLIRGAGNGADTGRELRIVAGVVYRLF